jgi:H+/Cl- antiporter ClcA
MNTTLFIEILAYTIPAVITGVVAYLLFNAHFKDQQNTRRWLIQKTIKTALPYDCRLMSV